METRLVRRVTAECGRDCNPTHKCTRNKHRNVHPGRPAARRPWFGIPLCRLGAERAASWPRQVSHPWCRGCLAVGRVGTGSCRRASVASPRHGTPESVRLLVRLPLWAPWAACSQLSETDKPPISEHSEPCFSMPQFHCYLIC